MNCIFNMIFKINTKLLKNQTCIIVKIIFKNIINRPKKIKNTIIIELLLHIISNLRSI